MIAERILAQTRHHGLLVLDGLTGVALSSFKNASGDPSSACFLGTSPSNPHNAASHSFLVTADATRPFMHIVQLDRSNEIQALHSHSVPERLPALALSPCGSFCFCGGVSGNLYVWDMASGDLLRCWRAHYKSITHLAVSEDGAFLFSAGEDAIVCCYCMEDILVLSEDKTRDPIRLHRWTAHAMPITSMAYFSLGPHQALIATASADQTLQFWRPHCDDPVLSFSFPVPIRHLAANPVTMECYICAGDSNIYVLDAGGLTDAATASFSMVEGGSGFATPVQLDTLPVFTGHQPHGGVAHCCCNAEGSILVSCASDGLRFWDTVSRQTVKHMPALRDVLTAVTVFSTSNCLPCGNVHDGGLSKRLVTASHVFGHTGGGLFCGQALLGGIFSSCLIETTYFPPIAAFKRKCMDTPPTVFRCSVNPEPKLQNALHTAVADILRNDTDIDNIASKFPRWCSRQLREVQRLQDLSALLETNALRRTLNRERAEQQERNAAVVDLVDTLCAATAGIYPRRSATKEETTTVTSDYCYTSDLQDVPLEPSNPNRPLHDFPLNGPFQDAGVYRPASAYLDRSFVLTKAKQPYSSRTFSTEECSTKAKTEALQDRRRTRGLDALFFVPSEHSESDAEPSPIASDATNSTTDKDDDDNWASDLATLEHAEGLEESSTEEMSGKESENDPHLELRRPPETPMSYKKTPNDSPVAFSVPSSSSRKGYQTPRVVLTPSPRSWTSPINGRADNPSACTSCYNTRPTRGLKRMGKRSSIVKKIKLVALPTQLHKPARHTVQILDGGNSIKNTCTLSTSSSSPASDSADDFSEVASLPTPCKVQLSVQRTSSEASKSPSSCPAFKFRPQRTSRCRNLPRSRSGLRRLNVHSKMAALIHNKTLLADSCERRGTKHTVAVADSSPTPTVLSSPSVALQPSHLDTLSVRSSEHRRKVSQASLLLSKTPRHSCRRRLVEHTVRLGIRGHQRSS